MVSFNFHKLKDMLHRNPEPRFERVYGGPPRRGSKSLPVTPYRTPMELDPLEAAESPDDHPFGKILTYVDAATGAEHSIHIPPGAQISSFTTKAPHYRDTTDMGHRSVDRFEEIKSTLSPRSLVVTNPSAPSSDDEDGTHPRIAVDSQNPHRSSLLSPSYAADYRTNYVEEAKPSAIPNAHKSVRRRPASLSLKSEASASPLYTSGAQVYPPQIPDFQRAAPLRESLFAPHQEMRDPNNRASARASVVATRIVPFPCSAEVSNPSPKTDEGHGGKDNQKRSSSRHPSPQQQSGSLLQKQFEDTPPATPAKSIRRSLSPVDSNKVQQESPCTPNNRYATPRSYAEFHLSRSELDGNDTAVSTRTPVAHLGLFESGSDDSHRQLLSVVHGEDGGTTPQGTGSPNHRLSPRQRHGSLQEGKSGRTPPSTSLEAAYIPREQRLSADASGLEQGSRASVNISVENPSGKTRTYSEISREKNGRPKTPPSPPSELSSATKRPHNTTSSPQRPLTTPDRKSPRRKPVPAYPTPQSIGHRRNISLGASPSVSRYSPPNTDSPAPNLRPEISSHAAERKEPSGARQRVDSSPSPKPREGSSTKPNVPPRSAARPISDPKWKGKQVPLYVEEIVETLQDVTTKLNDLSLTVSDMWERLDREYQPRDEIRYRPSMMQDYVA